MTFDLEADPQERYNLTNARMDNAFLFQLVGRYAVEYEISIAKYPNIKPRTEDFKGYDHVGVS